MLLTELIDIVKINTGQKELDFGELTILDYKTIVDNQVIPLLSRYIPFKQEQRLIISGSPHTYTTDIPDWISEVLPIDSLSVSSVFLDRLQGGSSVIPDSNKPLFIWKYVKPKLYIQYTGAFLVTSLHKLNLKAVGDPDILDFDILNLADDAEAFLTDLTTGYVLVAIGRARRSARLTELPIELDAAELVSEGLEMIEKVKIELAQRSKWWLAAL